MARRAVAERTKAAPATDVGKPARKRRTTVDAATIIPDVYRAFVFPNRLREQRRSHGFATLLQLAAALPGMTYLRLSKIERGTVFPRPDELRRIADALSTDPRELLIDLDDAGFDMAAWAEPLNEGRPVDPDELVFAIMLAVVLRTRRTSDPTLTFTVLATEYGLPPAILSRLENAQKPLSAWNRATVAALMRLFDREDEAGLREEIRRRFAATDYGAEVEQLTSPEVRQERTRKRIAELLTELDEPDTTPPTPDTEVADEAAPSIEAASEMVSRLPVLGAPLADGLILPIPSGEHIAAPPSVGARVYALRLCRPTLGGGMPGNAILFVDPDRYPSPGGLAVVTTDEGLRVLSVTLDRRGRMAGYSVSPDLEMDLGEVPPDRLATVIGASFV